MYYYIYMHLILVVLCSGLFYVYLVVNLSKAQQRNEYTYWFIDKGCKHSSVCRKEGDVFILLSYGNLYFQELVASLFRRSMDQILFKIGITTISKLVCLSASNT